MTQAHFWPTAFILFAGCLNWAGWLYDARFELCLFGGWKQWFTMFSD
jgi:hypothetical protein